MTASLSQGTLSSSSSLLPSSSRGGIPTTTNNIISMGGALERSLHRGKRLLADWEKDNLINNAPPKRTHILINDSPHAEEKKIISSTQEKNKKKTISTVTTTMNPKGNKMKK